MGVVSNGAANSVLVGRARELAALDAALGRVREGRPSAVLIGGEAGVGKSRLVSEFGARARAPGAVRVLSGYCLDLSAEGLPFAPFTAVLRELARELVRMSAWLGLERVEPAERGDLAPALRRALRAA